MAGDRLHRSRLLELAVRAWRRRMDHAVRRLEPGQLEPDRQRQLAACRGRGAGRQRQRLSRVEELVRRLPDQVGVLGRLRREQRHLPALRRPAESHRGKLLRGQHLRQAPRAVVRHRRDRRCCQGRADAEGGRPVEHLRDHRQRPAPRRHAQWNPYRRRSGLQAFPRPDRASVRRGSGEVPQSGDQAAMTTQEASTRPQVAIMNAVHDLPVLVARDAGFFKDEGLDLEFVTTPGMAQITTSHFVKFDSVFDRPLDSVYNEGGIDQYRMCEWGIMKRAVEADRQGLSVRKIVAMGVSMSVFAVVVSRDSGYYEPEMLKDKPIAVTPNNGSEFTTLKMMEGFLAPEHVKRITLGSMLKRLEAVRDGKVAAASVMEPWISVAQKWGMRILIESHSTRSEAAGDDLDGPTLARMFRAQARAVELLEKDPTPFVHYLARETGGLLELHELSTWRLLHAAPQPYTRDRFEDTYAWTVKWNMTVPGATYENTVDNRAWQ